jgi:hypothetical protein
MTEGDEVMQVLSDIGGFEVIRPEMREYVLPSGNPDALFTKSLSSDPQH